MSELMRILLLGHPELASNFALCLMVHALREHDLRIMLSEKKSSAQPSALSELERYDERLCEELDRNGGPVGLCGLAGLEQLCGHPVQTLKNPNSAKGLALLKNAAPELVISCRYRRILREEAIRLPAYGVINLHSGLLPEYRGVMATFWAILAQEKQIGATLHYISDPSIDTGAIVARSPIALNTQSSYLLNVLRLYPAGIDLVHRAVKDIESDGEAACQVQKGNGQYFSAPNENDLRAFHDTGSLLFDGAEMDWLLSRNWKHA